jgi:hypothetical protein
VKTARLVRALPAPPIKRSFPPIVDQQARVLVLGTLPGEESLRRGEYYAHPRNLFWPIVFALFDAVPAPSYAERLAFVAAHRIALWDVCKTGEREASPDSTLRRVSELDRPASPGPPRCPARSPSTAMGAQRPTTAPAPDITTRRCPHQPGAAHRFAGSRTCGSCA